MRASSEFSNICWRSPAIASWRRTPGRRYQSARGDRHQYAFHIHLPSSNQALENTPDINAVLALHQTGRFSGARQAAKSLSSRQVSLHERLVSV
ncbi:MAG: hypothetical protein Q8K05_01980, partial [Polaromonas sp.]|uniref:hypothetical protein n=1 Tax=Polaromonas sp. TaxID=1869339 RepID=UPI0027305C8F